LRSLDKCRTVLHDSIGASSAYLTYTGVPWIIRIRKEVIDGFDAIIRAAILRMPDSEMNWIVTFITSAKEVMF